jgi:hypothetical protein
MVSVSESATGTAYSAAATDAEGNSLTYTIAGGADAVHFSVDPSTGNVSFITPPDFENPSDSDFDNIYDVTLSVSDGQGGMDSIALSLTLTDTPNDPVKYRDSFFSAIEATTNVELATVEGETLLMDIYQPSNDTTQNRPVLIVASGGGFIVQDRTQVRFIAEEFARRGFVAATMDYRVLGGLPFNADAEGANTFQIRSDAMFVSGISAGGVMAATLATFDENDTAPSQAIQDYLDLNGGVFGTVGNNTAVNSDIQGAISISGAVLDLGTIDANSIPIYAAHNMIDSVVPCDTAPEGAAFTGLVVSGSCDFIPALQAVGVTTGLFLSPRVGHVDFTEEEFVQIGEEAAELFFEEVISP